MPAISTKTMVMIRQANKIRAAALLYVATLLLSACGTQSKMPEFTVFDPREQRQRDRSGTFTGTGWHHHFRHRELGRRCRGCGGGQRWPAASA